MQREKSRKQKWTDVWVGKQVSAVIDIGVDRPVVQRKEVGMDAQGKERINETWGCRQTLGGKRWYLRDGG